MSTKQTHHHEQTDRRTMLATLGAALGALAVAGCDDEPGELSSDDAVQTSVGALLAAGTAIVWVDSIMGGGTNLQSSTGSTLGNVVVVGGYNNPGDGGGGLFYWDAGAADAQDLGTIFGTATGRWKRLYSGAFNIRWFGATGDGSTDDGPALMLAATAAKAKRCGLYVPPGTYRSTHVLDLSGAESVPVRGDSSMNTGGYGGSTLQFEVPASPGSGQLTATGCAVNCADSYGVSLQNLNVVCLAGLTGTLVNFSSLVQGGYHSIKNCTLGIIGATGTLVRGDKTFNCSFDDVVWGGCDTAVAGPSTNSIFCNSWSFRNCINSGGSCITDVYVNPGESWSWYGCSIEALASGVARGIRTLTGRLAVSCSIEACWFGDATTTGAWVEGNFSALSAVGNQLQSNSNAVIGFKFHAACVGITCKGNAFLNLAAAWDFDTNASTNVDCTGNSFNGCTAISLGTPITGAVDTNVSPSVFDGAGRLDFSRFRARAVFTGSQSVPNNTVTQVNLVPDYDPNSNFASDTYTAPVAGYYQINSYVLLNMSTGYLASYVYVNHGASYFFGSAGAGNTTTGGASSVAADILHLNAGDVVDLRCFQDTGSAATVVTAKLSIHYLSS